MKFVLFVGLTTATNYHQLDESAPVLELAQKTTIFWDIQIDYDIFLSRVASLKLCLIPTTSKHQHSLSNITIA